MEKNENKIIINKYIELDRNFEIENETIIKHHSKSNNDYENICLLKYQKDIYFTCVNQFNKNITIRHGIYNKNINKNLKFSSNKNYSMFIHQNKIKFICRWFPLQIVNNKSEIIYTDNTPLCFKYIKSSTSGFLYENEIWFVGHLVVDNIDLPKNCYHCIIILDQKTLKIKKCSIPFRFSNSLENTVEYCLGIVVEKNRIIFSYSIMEFKSFIGIYDKKKIKEYFF